MDSCSDLKVLKDDRHVLLSVPYVFPSSPQITVFDLFLIWYYRLLDTVICVVHIMVKIIHISCCLFFLLFCELAMCLRFRLWKCNMYYVQVNNYEIVIFFFISAITWHIQQLSINWPEFTKFFNLWTDKTIHVNFYKKLCNQSQKE